MQLIRGEVKRGTIVVSKKRVPCGIQTQYSSFLERKVNIKLKQNKRENNIK